MLRTRPRLIFESAFAAGVLLTAVALSACGATDLFGRDPDPVQIQAGLNANATPSSAPCDYMALSGVGRRSGGPLYGQFPADQNRAGVAKQDADRLGLPLTDTGEAEWEALYAPTLNKLVAEKRIAAPTFAAYAQVYGCTRDAANPINRSYGGIQRVGAP